MAMFVSECDASGLLMGGMRISRCSCYASLWGVVRVRRQGTLLGFEAMSLRLMPGHGHGPPGVLTAVTLLVWWVVVVVWVVV